MGYQYQPSYIRHLPGTVFQSLTTNRIGILTERVEMQEDEAWVRFIGDDGASRCVLKSLVVVTNDMGIPARLTITQRIALSAIIADQLEPSGSFYRSGKQHFSGATIKRLKDIGLIVQEGGRLFPLERRAA